MRLKITIYEIDRTKSLDIEGEQRIDSHYFWLPAQKPSQPGTEHRNEHLYTLSSKATSRHTDKFLEYYIYYWEKEKCQFHSCQIRDHNCSQGA